MDTNDYIKLYNLKVDPKIPHHYIIGIATRSVLSKNPGEIYLKYGPIYFTNDDVVQVAEALQLSKDKLFKTTSEEALSGRGVSQLVASLTALTMIARMNEASLHHFSSEEEISKEDFEYLIKTAKTERTKELLKDSKLPP